MIANGFERNDVLTLIVKWSLKWDLKGDLDQVVEGEVVEKQRDCHLNRYSMICVVLREFPRGLLRVGSDWRHFQTHGECVCD